MKSTITRSGLVARVAVRPGYDCPIRQLSEDGYIRTFRPGRSDGHSPQITVEPPNEKREEPLANYPIEEITWVGGGVICQLPTVGPTSTGENDDEATTDGPDDGQFSPSCENYGGGGCLAYGFSFLPVEPYRFY